MNKHILQLHVAEGSFTVADASVNSVVRLILQMDIRGIIIMHYGKYDNIFSVFQRNEMEFYGRQLRHDGNQVIFAFQFKFVSIVTRNIDTGDFAGHATMVFDAVNKVSTFCVGK